MINIRSLLFVALTALVSHSNAVERPPQITCVVSLWLSQDSLMADSRQVKFTSENSIENQDLEVVDSAGKIVAKSNFDYQFIGHNQILMSANIFKPESNKKILTVMAQLREDYFLMSDQTLFLIAEQANGSRGQVFCTNEL